MNKNTRSHSTHLREFFALSAAADGKRESLVTLQAELDDQRTAEPTEEMSEFLLKHKDSVPPMPEGVIPTATEKQVIGPDAMDVDPTPKQPDQAQPATLKVPTVSHLVRKPLPALPPSTNLSSAVIPSFPSNDPIGEPPASVYDLVALNYRTAQKPLHALASTPTKTLTTTQWSQARTEQMNARMLDHIDKLRQNDSWSMKQPKRFCAPPRIKTHHDFLLEEVKWLAVDYRQERKWKITMAYLLASEALEYYIGRLLWKYDDIEMIDHELSYDEERLKLQYVVKPQVPQLIYEENFRYPTIKSQNIYRSHCDNPLDERCLDSTECQAIVPLSSLAYMPVIIAVDPAVLLPDDRRFIISAEKSHSVFHVPGVSEIKTPHVPLQGPKSSAVKAPEWSVEEEEFLLVHASFYNFNWTLLSDMLHSFSHAPRDYKSSWDISQRWDVLRKSSKEDRMKDKEKSKTRRDDSKKQASRHMDFFDTLHRIIKKRDVSVKTTAPPAKSTKNVMTAHVSHQAIASRAGVDPRNYRDILQHNERRLQMQKAVEIQRNTMTLAAAPLPHQVRSPRHASAQALNLPTGQVPAGARPQPNARMSASMSPTQPSRQTPQQAMTPVQVQQFLQRQALLKADTNNVPTQQQDQAMMQLPTSQITAPPPAKESSRKQKSKSVSPVRESDNDNGTQAESSPRSSPVADGDLSSSSVDNDSDYTPAPTTRRTAVPKKRLRRH